MLARWDCFSLASWRSKTASSCRRSEKPTSMVCPLLCIWIVDNSIVLWGWSMYINIYNSSKNNGDSLLIFLNYYLLCNCTLSKTAINMQYKKTQIQLINSNPAKLDLMNTCVPMTNRALIGIFTRLVLFTTKYWYPCVWTKKERLGRVSLRASPHATSVLQSRNLCLCFLTSPKYHCFSFPVADESQVKRWAIHALLNNRPS